MVAPDDDHTKTGARGGSSTAKSRTSERTLASEGLALIANGGVEQLRGFVEKSIFLEAKTANLPPRAHLLSGNDSPTCIPLRRVESLV